MTLDEGWVIIEIADTGIDIEGEALSRIFTPFSQENRNVASSAGIEVIIRLPGLEKEFTVTNSIIGNENDETLTSSARVLIIEDKADSALLMQTFLEGLGYQVRIAFNGIDGIALARQFSPDVILSDISLTSEMDGYTVARTIRSDSELNSIPLIAISGYGQPEDKEKAKAAGFDTHLTKPLNLNLLVNSIAEKIARANENF